MDPIRSVMSVTKVFIIATDNTCYRSLVQMVFLLPIEHQNPLVRGKAL